MSKRGKIDACQIELIGNLPMDLKELILQQFPNVTLNDKNYLEILDSTGNYTFRIIVSKTYNNHSRYIYNVYMKDYSNQPTNYEWIKVSYNKQINVVIKKLTTFLNSIKEHGCAYQWESRGLSHYVKEVNNA